MRAFDKKRLEELGFKLDKGGFWQRWNGVTRLTIGEPAMLSMDGTGWVLVADCLDEVDATVGVEPVEEVCLRFPTLAGLLDALIIKVRPT